MEAVPAPRHEPVVVGDAVGVPGAGGRAQRVVVLGAPVDGVHRGRVVHVHPVELGHRQVLEEAPGRAAVEALVEAPVAPDEVVVDVVGVDPHRVVVHVLVAFAQVPPGLARVVRHLEEDVHRVDSLRVLRVDEYLLVVHGAAGAVISLLLPGLAAVRGAEGAPRLVGGGRLHDGVDGVGVGRGDREADASHLLLRQAALQPLPGLAPVRRLVQAGLGAAIDQREDVPPALVGGGDEGVGVAGVHDHVRDAGVFGDRQDGAPRLPAVRRLVEAPVAAGRPQGPLGGHVHDVRVLRVDEDLADVLRGLEPHVLPALAPVLALVHAVAVADAPLRVVLAGAHPHDVGVLRVERDAADGIGALAVEHGRPGAAGVLGLPDAARGHGHEPALVVGGVHGDVGDPAGRHRGADAAQLEAAPGVGRPAALRLLVLVGLLRGLGLLRRPRILRGLGLLRRLALVLLGGDHPRGARGQGESGDQGSQLLQVQLRGCASIEAPAILRASVRGCKRPSTRRGDVATARRRPKGHG